MTVLIFETTGSALNVGLAFAISLVPNGIGFLTRVNRNIRLMLQYWRVTLLAALTTVLAGMALLIRLHWALFIVVFLLGSLGCSWYDARQCRHHRPTSVATRRGLILILSLAGTAMGVWFVAHLDRHFMGRTRRIYQCV